MKKAILVAMAEESPFSEIKEEIYPILRLYYQEHGYEVFFTYGRKSSKYEIFLRRSLERLRWNNFYLLLRIFDLITLSSYKIVKPKVEIRNDVMRVDVPEDLRHLSIKILHSLNKLKDMGYDLVVRTTVSSIVIPENLELELGQLGKSNILYAGRVINQLDGFSFVSGCFTVLNQQSISFLYSNRRRLDYSLIDDVSFGKLYEKFGIMPLSLSSVNVGDLDAVTELNLLDGQSHFRCKSGLVNRRDTQVLFGMLKKIGRMR